MRSIILLCLITVSELSAQNVDYNKIIYPSQLTGLPIEEKLVRLAWKNYPANMIAQHEVNSAKQQIGVAGSSWLSLIGVSANLNEFNINPASNPNQNNFYPRYNIGASIPLGVFIEIPKQVKIAKEGYEISKQKLNQQKLFIRAEVLTRYQVYLKAKSLFELQAQNTELRENNFSVIRERFLNDDATLTEYNNSLDNLNAAKSTSINAENDYIISKIALEAILGVQLESVE